nr:hypothetical protein [Tanacetum cinerariifolium]
MKKLPIKSLAQFRSVSKAWKSLIDSVKFIADHYYNVCQPQHLFIIYAPYYHFVCGTDAFNEFISIVDDETFSQCNLTRESPYSHMSSILVGSLFCFYNPGISKAFLWNPSIRKSIAIVVSSREEFREIHLPESIKSRSLSISKLRETLVVLEYNKVALCARQLCAVWMMNNDSFTQIYAINAPATSLDTILGFRNNGAMIIERQNDKKECTENEHRQDPTDVNLVKIHRALDMRTEIRRQSTSELEIFKQRWEKAVKEDPEWVDPFFLRKQRPPTPYS